jgi:hypothetical protein
MINAMVCREMAHLSFQQHKTLIFIPYPSPPFFYITASSQLPILLKEETPMYF